MAPSKSKNALKLPSKQAVSKKKTSNGVPKENTKEVRTKSTVSSQAAAAKIQPTPRKDRFGVESDVEEQENTNLMPSQGSNAKKRPGTSTTTNRAAKRHKPDPSQNNKPAQPIRGLKADNKARSVNVVDNVPKSSGTRSGRVYNDKLESEAPSSGQHSDSASGATDTGLQDSEPGNSDEPIGRRTRSHAHEESPKKPTTRAPIANMGQSRTKQATATSQAEPAGETSANDEYEPDTDENEPGTEQSNETPSRPRSQEYPTGNRIIVPSTSKPNRKLQPELAKEYKFLELPTVENAGFFGKGNEWTEITRQREQLLTARAELADPIPSWYNTYVNSERPYPMSEKGEDAIASLSIAIKTVKATISADKLVQKLTQLTQSLKEFQRDENQEQEIVQADLCHLIIPQFIRFIHIFGNRHNFFQGFKNDGSKFERNALTQFCSLFKTLLHLSDIPGNMVKENKSLGLETAISEALEKIHASSDTLLTTIQDRLDRNHVERQIRETEREQSRNIQAAIEEREQLEKAIKDTEQRLQIVREETERQRAEAERKRQQAEEQAAVAARLRQALDEQSRVTMELKRQAAARYYAEESLAVEEQIRLSRPVLPSYVASSNNMRGRSTARTASESENSSTPGPSHRQSLRATQRGPIAKRVWSTEEDCALISRLARFAKLESELKYARCLDCLELQDLSIEIVRARALEIKPTLEWQHEKNKQPVPGWISAIS